MSLHLMSPIGDDELTLWAEEAVIQPGETARLSAAADLEDIGGFAQALAGADMDALPCEMSPPTRRLVAKLAGACAA